AVHGERRRFPEFDLFARARQRQGVSGKLRPHRIGQVFPLATHGEHQQLGNDRGEDPRDHPYDDQEDGELSQPASFIPVAAASSPPPPPSPSSPPAAPTQARPTPPHPPAPAANPR